MSNDDERPRVVDLPPPDKSAAKWEEIRRRLPAVLANADVAHPTEQPVERELCPRCKKEFADPVLLGSEGFHVCGTCWENDRLAEPDHPYYLAD